MRQTKLLLLILLAVIGFSSATYAAKPKAYDPTTGNFYLLGKDGHETYTVDGNVTFIATKSSTTPTYKDNGVTFYPKNEGEIIVATVEEIDLAGKNYLLTYDGEKVTGKYGTSDGKNQSSYLPDGWNHKLIAGSEGTVISSASPDGKLTFGYHASSADGQKGFKILVQSVVPKDMSFVSATVSLPSLELYRGAKNQVIAGACVATEGMNNALKLNEVSFNLSNLSSSQVSNVRAYLGNNFSDDNLIATNLNVGSDVTITHESALKSGKNYVYIVANLAPDFVGVLPSSTLTSVKVGNDNKITTPEAMPSATVLNSIFMPTENVVYTISDAANFYDDGGINGKITENFEGSITFLPATAGNKVKIDFSKLEIFNSSSTGKNDVFKFYNGRTASEENLITTLLKDKKIVKSTADDGSMTVTLKSITGVPTNGWEAMVSQFLPGNMTIQKVSADTISTANIAAADTDQPFVVVNVVTENILNPLTLSSINLEVNGKATAVKVYSLGENPTFSTTKLFGSAEVSSLANTVTGSQALNEGNNYFAIVADINPTVLNDETLTLKATSVVIGDSQTSISGTTEATRVVKNIFHHTPGENTRVMYGDWVFTDTKDKTYTNNYVCENADCIVTFKPAEAGYVSEISFDSFDVFYSSTSYGTKATFEIYSGDSVDEKNLIWKLSNNSQQATGPDKVLRSSAADGALTIKFNANTSTSYYSGKGWVAQVRPFRNHDMEIKSIDVEQSSTEDIFGSDTDQNIIKFAVTTDGSLTSKTVKEINIDVKDSAPLLSKVKVLYSANNKELKDSVVFGTADYVSGNVVKVEGSQVLPEGISYFWVQYDIKSAVVDGTKVDAKLVSIKTDDDATVTPVNGDPEGERIAKNVYLLKSGDNGSIKIKAPLSFYDDGGPSGKYSKTLDGFVTFLPANDSEVVRLTFKSFKVNSTKIFSVYDGVAIDKDKLNATARYNVFPSLVASHSADGALTVHFANDGGYNDNGWEILVESIVPTPFVTDSLTATSVANASIMRGAMDVPFVKLALTVSGEKDALNISEIKGNLTGSTSVSDIKNLKLWYTKKSESFYNATQLCEIAPSETFSFKPENIAITNYGTYNFWVTASISNDATATNNVSVAISEIVTNGSTSTQAIEKSKASSKVKAGLNGVYTIGTSAAADYATINDAITALAGGVEGKVTFNIEAGNYPENIIVKDIQGASEANPIVFTSATGNASDVVISGSGYSAPAYGSLKYGMAVIENTPYVTFDKLSFIPSDKSYPHIVHIYDRSFHTTISNCIITSDIITTSGYSGTNLIKEEAVNEEGKNNDYLTIEGNTLTGGYVSLYLGGTGYVALPKEKGLIVRNNVITNPSGKGIYVTENYGTLIEGNTISCSTSQKTDYNGIDIYRASNGLTLRNNVIVNTQDVYSKGISIRTDSKGTADNLLKVYNNSIAITASPNASSYGLSIGKDCEYLDVQHNSININGVAGYAASILGPNVTFANNLLQNATPYPVFSTSDNALASIKLANNAYYTVGEKFSSVGGDTFDDWKATTNDTTSILEKADFLSDTDLHLKTAGNLNFAAPVDYITTDIDGNARDTKNPTVGAYEFHEIEVVTPVIAEGYPAKGNVTYNSIEVRTKWSEGGTLHYMIQPSATPAPEATVLAEAASVNVMKDTESTVTFSELDQNTAYKAYFLNVSSMGASSDVVASEEISTLRHILPLEAIVSADKSDIDTGSSITITPIVEGGDYPYTYSWKNRMNQVVSTDSILTTTLELSEEFTLTVTSADKQTQKLSVQVPVYGKRSIASFDDNYLDTESNWHGSENVDDSGVAESKFFSGSFSFTNTNMPAYSFWGGFAYANSAETTFESLADQYRNVVGGGAKETASYAVLYSGMSESTIEALGSRDGETINGVYLTNSAFTLNSILNGDGFAQPFATGDYHKVVFTDDDDDTNKVEFYLADYRDEDPTKHYALTEWKWCDLSSLGQVKSITVTTESSNVYVPSYACIDQLGTASTGTEKIALTHHITIYPVPATTVINIEGITGSYKARIFSIDGNLCAEYANLANEAQIPVETLSQGSYLLEITTPEGTRTVKQFIKR